MRPFQFRGLGFGNAFARGSFRNGMPADVSGSRLKPQADFGPNPGDLELFAYRPRGLPAGTPLMVILHGCKQDARGYDHGAGWSALADRFGFAVIAPQQHGGNNLNHCWDWFLPEHTKRDQGEPASIRQMVAWAVKTYGSDPRRIFISGLSSGGGMAAVMLATYPEVFAGGAIIAGLPYVSASNVQQAFAAMQAPPAHTPKQWGDLVRQAFPHQGPWPRLSLWQGDADTTVSPANLEALIAQWTDVHHAGPAHEELGPGLRHRVWQDKTGKPVVEAYTIAGMGHGTPIAAATGAERGEHPAPYILDVGISSSLLSAQFFGLAPKGEKAARSQKPLVPAVIAKALKAAGLMR